MVVGIWFMAREDKTMLSCERGMGPLAILLLNAVKTKGLTRPHGDGSVSDSSVQIGLLFHMSDHSGRFWWCVCEEVSVEICHHVKIRDERVPEFLFGNGRVYSLKRSSASKPHFEEKASKREDQPRIEIHRQLIAS